jgi:hypothetical protein
MPAEVEGLEEFRLFLVALPTELMNQADIIVGGAANDARDDLAAAYPIDTKLASGLIVRGSAANGIASRLLTNTLTESVYYEYGTELRHTTLGFNRGKEPPHPVFWPIVNRRRLEMYRELIALVVTNGFDVNEAEAI